MESAIYSLRTTHAVSPLEWTLKLTWENGYGDLNVDFQ